MNQKSPPIETVETAKRHLSEHVAALARRRSESRTELGALLRRRQDMLLEGYRSREAELKQINQEAQALRKKIAAQNLERWTAARTAARGLHTLDATGFVFRAPPYDFAWTSGLGQGSESADPNAGTYSLDVQSIGDHGLTAAAGVGFWFFSQTGNPAQRFANLLDFFDDWWDDAAGYTANNDGRTNIGVFGASEQAWVSQTVADPSWSDGVGWFESHGNNGQGGDSGTVSNQTFFNAQPNSWYQCWMWSTAFVDADSGFFGFADSTIHMRMSVPFAVLGSLG